MKKLFNDSFFKTLLGEFHRKSSYGCLELRAYRIDISRVLKFEISEYFYLENDVAMIYYRSEGWRWHHRHQYIYHQLTTSFGKPHHYTLLNTTSIIGKLNTYEFMHFCVKKSCWVVCCLINFATIKFSGSIFDFSILWAVVSLQVSRAVYYELFRTSRTDVFRMWWE